MSNVVLDASALLTLLNAEPGADVIEAAMAADGAVMSVVNWAEVLSKAVETGVTHVLEAHVGTRLRIAAGAASPGSV